MSSDTIPHSGKGPMDSAAKENAKPKGIQGIKAPVLSRTGLLLVILILMGSPILLIGTVWFTLPPIREAPLDAKISLVDFVDVVEFESKPQSEKEKVFESIRNEEFVPAIAIRNASEEKWEGLGVSINGTFDFITAESLESGEEKQLYLHRFQTRQGDGFKPLRYEVRDVRVFARLPGGERGFFECEIDSAGNPVYSKDEER